MKKLILGLAALASVAVTAPAFAQPGPPPGVVERHELRREIHQERRELRHDRIAARRHYYRHHERVCTFRHHTRVCYFR